MPIRIQRKRTKGYKLPPNTVCCTRGTRWGNTFIVGKDGTAEDCIQKYANSLLPYSHHGGTMHEFMLSEANLSDIIESLRGKNIACWCKIGSPCHGDWLLEIANR